MGHRLSRIYTRTGDDGSTSLGDGTRVAKHCLRVEAYGAVDELNSHIGLLITIGTTSTLTGCLNEIQHALFDLGGELCIPGYEVINDNHVVWLEAWLDFLNQSLPPLKDFVLPGGNMAAAQCHIARTVCRRAERRVVALAELGLINPVGLRYLNRLSDLLFVIARTLANDTEVLWVRERRRPMPPTDANELDGFERHSADLS